jgi:large subunit ribosomal protein L15
MPLQRRIPKRGFKNFNRVEYQAVNVRDLARIKAGEVTPEVLKAHGLIGNLKKPVKILGTGEIEGAYRVSAHAFSGTARAKIEGAGGEVTVLSGFTAGVEAEGAGSEKVAVAVPEVTDSEEAPAPEGEGASEAEDEEA